MQVTSTFYFFLLIINIMDLFILLVNDHLPILTHFNQFTQL